MILLGNILYIFFNKLTQTNISMLSQRPSKLRNTLRLNLKHSGFKYLCRWTFNVYGLSIL